MNEQVKQTEPTEPLKYVRTYSIEGCNKRYEEGYRVHSVITTLRQEDVSGRFMTDISYLMSFQEQNKYDDIDKFKKLIITEQEQTVPQGWRVIHHTSKELIAVKDHAAKGD